MIFCSGVLHRADQIGGLLDCGLYLTLGRNTVAHERKREAVAFLRFRNHPNAAHPDHDLIARL